MILAVDDHVLDARDLLAVGVGRALADALSAKVAQLLAAVKRGGRQFRLGDDGHKAVARPVLRGHAQPVPAQLAQTRAHCAVDVAHVRGEHGRQVLIAAVAPDVGACDGHGLVTQIVQHAGDAEGQHVQLVVHGILDAIGPHDLRMLLAVQLDGSVRVMDRADHDGLGRRQNALRAHADRGVGIAPDVGDAHQVRAQLIRERLDGQGQLVVHNIPSIQVALILAWTGRRHNRTIAHFHPTKPPIPCIQSVHIHIFSLFCLVCLSDCPVVTACAP